MIDFASIKGVAIPEGSVKRITHNGFVLWEKPSAQDEYTFLEFLQFDADMVFDTGIICTNNTQIEIGFIKESDTAQYLYGVRTANNTASVTAYLNTNGAWRFGNTYKTLTFNRGTRYDVAVNSSGVLVETLLNKYNATVKAFTAPYTLTIGSARTTAGEVSDAQFAGKLYYFRVYEGDSIVLDYSPCVTSQGIYGFWDSVAGKFVAPI